MNPRERAHGALFDTMRDALRSAPGSDRKGAFPRAWWSHLAERGLLGLGFDADGREPRADWAAVARLSGLVARETCSIGLALAWLMNEMLGRFVIGPHASNDGHRALLRGSEPFRLPRWLARSVS